MLVLKTAAAVTGCVKCDTTEEYMLHDEIL